MIGWTIKTCFRAMGWLVKLSLLCMAITFFLGVNCFTIPLFLVLCAGCKIFKQTPPHFAFYGLTAYPTWKYGPHATFRGDLRKMNREADYLAWKRTRWMGRPWEARFFD